MSQCSLDDWLTRVVAVVAQVVHRFAPAQLCVSARCPPPSTLAQIATTWRPTPCTQGKSWQFKDFHVKEPAQVTSAVQRDSCCKCLISHQIFSTVKGFYVQYTESLCDACIAAWNVQVLHKTVKIYHGSLDIACRWCASAAAAAIWTAPPSARCGRASRSMRTGAG
jgi:hypothetical protein